jgi:membrane fusion protein (multidrug efflux system)
MTTVVAAKRRTWPGSSLLLLSVLGTGGGLAAWKEKSIAENAAAAAHQPEPMETVTVATAGERDYRRTTTAIGTVIALQSITLHNELPGTVATVALEPGQIVEPGTVLVALDVSVEQAELRAQQAQAALAETMLDRMQRANSKSAASQADVDRARAERDIALAQVARTQAIIARKTIRAPFRAHVGMADVHLGQYLREGTQLTTLQGIDDAVHVDFTVTQAVAAGLQPGETVEILIARGATAGATIEALDARVDPATRNETVRARLEHQEHGPAPGAAVRVHVPLGPPQRVVAVPVSALRKGPGGDHVFVVAAGEDKRPRAHLRPVKSGAVLGDEVAILEGLAAGEQVAASGSFKLFESEAVAIADPKPDAAPPNGQDH